MAQRWDDIMKKADGNSRTAAQKLQEAQKTREQFKQQSVQQKPINNDAIQMILERRRKEKEALEAARLKAAKQKKTEQLGKKPTNSNVPKSTEQKATPVQKETIKNDTSKDPSKSVKQHLNGKPKPPPLSFQEIMKAAELNASGKPLPKEIVHRLESQKPKSAPTASTTVVSKTRAEPEKTNGSKAIKTIKNSQQLEKSTITKNRASSVPVRKTTTDRPVSNGNKTKTSSVVSTSKITQKPVSTKPTTSISKVPPVKPKEISSNNKTTNGTIKSTMSAPVTSNQIRPSLPVNQRLTNPRQPNRIVQPKKRSAIESDDEDDEDLQDFIVDDDNCDGFDYKKELQETLMKNFRFDARRYQHRFIDDDDDDLANMESSFDQIEREEEYSRRIGLKEDIEDILREEAEKRKRSNQGKKRAKTS